MRGYQPRWKQNLQETEAWIFCARCLGLPHELRGLIASYLKDPVGPFYPFSWKNKFSTMQEAFYNFCLESKDAQIIVWQDPPNCISSTTLCGIAATEMMMATHYTCIAYFEPRMWINPKHYVDNIRSWLNLCCVKKHHTWLFTLTRQGDNTASTLQICGNDYVGFVVDVEPQLVIIDDAHAIPDFELSYLISTLKKTSTKVILCGYMSSYLVSILEENEAVFFDVTLPDQYDQPAIEKKRPRLEE